MGLLISIEIVENCRINQYGMKNLVVNLANS